ncbi:sterol desaturase family protein [Hephaestia sp. GCM10023244]|uniref:sterol desaturase family protein n=1 Tax=unclassified Hephaestia TaxID=2631281 RepID=UPI00207736D4|nr:sterol desaturase family protein [Hephaestia sp. MAHUQ-44]MCM8730362.1 sterol desaturase family protein [Hephaestia sp. MAHUQ-44]
MAEITHSVRYSYIGWFAVFLILTLFEMLNPLEDQPLKKRVNGAIFWAIFIPLTAAFLALWANLRDTFGVSPLIALPNPANIYWAGPLAGVVAGLVGAIVNDFFFYWFHRLQHRWLWRWHTVHHSIRDLNAVNSYHHPSEAFIALIFYTIPASLIATNAGSALPFVVFGLWLHIVWIHSPTKANFGILRIALVDNRFHRIHHSLDERHFDKNFGAFTTLWDRLFGTAYFPTRDEWPDVGLAEIAEPHGIAEWVEFPVKYSRQSDLGTGQKI